MKMRWMMMAVVGLVVAAFGADVAPGIKQVAAVELASKKVVIVGVLGKPLGTFMTVEADYEGPRLMTQQGGLVVSRIDEADLQDAVRIYPVNDVPGMSKKLEQGRRYRLRGYETGGMSGQPDDPKNPPTKEELQGRQAVVVGLQTLGFETQFCVTGIENLGPSKKGIN